MVTITVASPPNITQAANRVMVIGNNLNWSIVSANIFTSRSFATHDQANTNPMAHLQIATPYELSIFHHCVAYVGIELRCTQRKVSVDTQGLSYTPFPLDIP